MANEFNSIQIYRRVSIEFTIILVWVFLVGANLRATSYSQASFTDLSEGVVNPVLLFAINSSIWMAVCLVQVELVVMVDFVSVYIVWSVLQE